MKPAKSLFLKTYGKQRRKPLSAWISPENRKQAFDSSLSSEGDVSVFEPAKPASVRERRTSPARPKAARPTRKKAPRCLTEKSCDGDEENVTPAPPLPQQGKKARGKKAQVCGSRAVRPAKRKAVLHVSSDEENISQPTPPNPQPPRHNKTTSAHRSVGRFVTRRRRRAAAAAKPKLHKAFASILNSSDDFTSGAARSSGALRPARRKNVPPAFLVSSAEDSMSAAGTTSFVTNPFPEISLNESADISLGPYTRKPIFCSTPSAGPFSKRPRLKPCPVTDKSSNPASMAGGCRDVLSPFQKYAQGLPVSPPLSATPTGLRSDGNAGELSRSNRLSVDSESGVEFVSAAGGLDWLIEALKEQCLTKPCAVQLQRVDNLAVTQLCGQTTYSSCLGISSSLRGEHTNEHPVSVDSPRTTSCNLPSSEANSETRREDLHSAISLVSSGQASSVMGSSLLSAVCKRSEGDSAHRTVASVEFIMDTREESDLAQNSDVTEELPCAEETTEGMAAPLELSAHSVGDGTTGDATAALTAALKEACLSDQPVVKVRRLTLAQIRRSKRAKSTTGPSDSAGDERRKEEHQAESDPNLCEEDSSRRGDGEKHHSSSSGDGIPSEREVISCHNLPKRRKVSLLPPQEKKRRSTSTDRPGTTRKACVSGLSVSRWKTNGGAVARTRTRDARAVDSSINELMSTKHKQPREFGAIWNFSTPVRASPLNLSTLLADFTPNTHTWSRLKAALSVHRKVLRTPRSSQPSASLGRMPLADLSQDLFATPSRTMLPKWPHHDSTVEGGDAELSDAEKVYAECGQERPLPWEECILPHRMKRCVKIGEGTFGEVFSTTNASGDTVALKVIPLEGSERVNGEEQKTFGEILHEIIISKELSCLKEKERNQTHSFIGLNDLHCVRGGYPPDFLRAWDTFDQKKGSENDRPDAFEKDQFFLILEFEFGGVDLENSNGTLATLGVAKSILHQVTAAMAVAEQELHFEHRDLHWGNVLVKTTKQKTGSFILNGATHSLETKGVLVRIIDYSLSRLEIDDLTVSCDISKDEELFMGQGDYQFDIYRLMRQENGNNWADFHPYTNVLWLHYLCSKLLSMKYRASGKRVPKGVRVELTRFHDNILQYTSATEALHNCPMFQ